MIEWLVAAPASGGGKTVLACALLQALKRRGLSPCAFKCGPDYIDSMFHRAVLGVASCNLDLFLSDETAVRRLYARGCAGHGAAIVEGVMGLYDGLGGVTDRASAWHMADTLGLPVLLCLRPKGSSLTLAAQVKGLQAFRRDSHIAALFLTDCSAMLYQTLSPMLERETGLPVLGYLPHMETAVVESRHLGLRTAGEIKDLAARLCAVAAVLEETLDWPRFFALGRGPARPLPDRETEPGALRVPIAVAQDEAFCFTYAESLDMLRRCGAQLLPFRPWTTGRCRREPARCIFRGLPGAVCPVAGGKRGWPLRGGGSGDRWHAHSGRVRRLFVSGAGAAGNGWAVVSHGWCASWKGGAKRRPGALWLCPARGGEGEPVAARRRTCTGA